MDNIEKLYKNYEILAEAKENISEHEDKYIEILEAVKGEEKEKRLASQFIARFFKDFPNLSERAIDAQLDLCEDENMAIRKQAIKDLPTFCKDTKEYMVKIADVLAQLLQADEASEVTVVHSSLMTLFKMDARATLTGLFSQIVNGEEVVRERAIRFLCVKVKTLPPDVITKEVEDCLLQECKRVMQDVTGEEFVALIGLLSTLKISKTIPGQQAIVDIVADQVDLDKDFDHSDPDTVGRLLQCVRQALPFFSPYVGASRFIRYICTQVVPGLGLLPPLQEGVDVGLELLKLLAEMSPYNSDLDSAAQCLDVVFNKLLEFMPLPPAEDASSENKNGDSLASPTRPEEPQLQLSHVECLMFAFHQLGKKHPDFLVGEDGADRLRDFKLRLQYLARGIQGYIKKLREALHGKKGDQLQTEENKLKLVALRTTSNINTLIKDLFHSPPSYNSTIKVSWKPVSTKGDASPTVSLGGKRPERTPIVFEDDGGAPKIPKKGGERELYSPPGGKYSTKVSSFQFPFGRGRGGGYGRGRGRFSNWY